MFELIGIAVVIWVIWKVFKAVARTATTQAYHQGTADGLSLNDAEAKYEEAEQEFIGAVFAPMGLTGAETQSMLDRAVFLKDRVNQLSGGETGSVFRARHRNELITKANQFGPQLAAQFEQHKQNREKQEARTYGTFEDWLKVFKVGAGEANDLLAETDKGSLIDVMDLTPLRRAFAEAVEPHQLGVEFGRQFDFAEFVQRNHGAT